MSTESRFTLKLLTNSGRHGYALLDHDTEDTYLSKPDGYDNVTKAMASVTEKMERLYGESKNGTGEDPD